MVDSAKASWDLLERSLDPAEPQLEGTCTFLMQGASYTRSLLSCFQALLLVLYPFPGCKVLAGGSEPSTTASSAGARFRLVFWWTHSSAC